MIDKFSKEQFEQALFNIHPGYEVRGMIAGEECYYIPVNENARIQIRSSIGKDGYAKSSGDDSIRTWLEIYKPIESHKYDWQSTGKKVDRFTTRVAGWPDRLGTKIRKLFDLGVKIKKAIEPCLTCGKSPWAAFSNSTKNPGRPYASCRPCNYFTWLDTAPLKGSQVTLFELPKEEAPKPDTPKSEVFTFDDMADDTPTHEWILEQRAIFDFVENKEGHGVVRGVAGCAKTTTAIEAFNRVSDNAIILAFNRHIARELQGKGVDAQTFHSLGKQAIDSVMDAEFNQWKVHNIIDRLYYKAEEKAVLLQINSLLKANLIDPTYNNILAMNIDYDIDKLDSLVEMSKAIFQVDRSDDKEYNFDDMIIWPISGKGRLPSFNFLFVDEHQDLNLAQNTFAEELVENGHMLLIGDPNQSIYAFRGAYIGIMDMMQDKLEATILSLPVSFRAPLAIVNRINRRYPEIDFRSAPGAIEGEILEIDEWQLVNHLKEGDNVICRTNAPLISPCFSLIRRGIKATILGRDIGKSLISLIDKRSKLQRVITIIDLVRDLRTYLGNETPKLEATRKYSRIATLQDQIETITAIADGCDSISQLRSKIKSTFTEERRGIVFSSIHKFKGLEGERIFILHPDKKLHPKADPEQERNIRYVADTRTLDKLFLVYGEE